MSPSSYSKSAVSKGNTKKAAHHDPKKFVIINNTYSNLTHPSCPISRNPSSYVMTRTTSDHYPSLEEIACCARAYGGDHNEETFKDLYLGDMIWGNTISAELSMRDPRKVKVLAPLVELIGRGIFNRSPDELCNAVEERAMRFSAVCDCYLFDFCVELQDQVHLLYPEHCYSGLMKVS